MVQYNNLRLKSALTLVHAADDNGFVCIRYCTVDHCQDHTVVVTKFVCSDLECDVAVININKFFYCCCWKFFGIHCKILCASAIHLPCPFICLNFGSGSNRFMLRWVVAFGIFRTLSMAASVIYYVKCTTNKWAANAHGLLGMQLMSSHTTVNRMFGHFSFYKFCSKCSCVSNSIRRKGKWAATVHNSFAIRFTSWNWILTARGALNEVRIFQFIQYYWRCAPLALNKSVNKRIRESISCFFL